MWAAGEPIFLVPKFGRRLRGRNDGALSIYEFEKVELLRLGNRLGIIEVAAIVGRRAAQGERHASEGVAGRNRLHAMQQIFSPPIELTLKLRNQGSATLLIGTLKCPPGDVRHDPGNRCYRD